MLYVFLLGIKAINSAQNTNNNNNISSNN